MRRVDKKITYMKRGQASEDTRRALTWLKNNLRRITIRARHHMLCIWSRKSSMTKRDGLR